MRLASAERTKPTTAGTCCPMLIDGVEIWILYLNQGPFFGRISRYCTPTKLQARSTGVGLCLWSCNSFTYLIINSDMISVNSSAPGHRGHQAHPRTGPQEPCFLPCRQEWYVALASTCHPSYEAKMGTLLRHTVICICAQEDVQLDNWELNDAL